MKRPRLTNDGEAEPTPPPPLPLPTRGRESPAPRLVSIRHGQRTLIVEDLADALLLLGRQLAVVGRQVRPDGEAPLHAGPCADLVEPPLEVLELVDVLALCLPADGPGKADDVGDGEL